MILIGDGFTEMGLYGKLPHDISVLLRELIFKLGRRLAFL